MDEMEKPLELLEYIRAYITEHGFAPSMAEMVSDHGLSSTSVARHYLNKLEKDGRIKRTPRTARAIRIVNESIDAS